ncbi:hypothetical protein EVG20_g3724 [Dentipellis fragilis]|uniref:DUF7223 domain-containing protein n=1 Tax=Dentipellis fragilis TaxID=205917 RepID=A0A4Y9Z2E3_9AGAM|nr:hypothetical protein EVG20_g3724 [Dentipellis fragilis]
MSTFSKFAFIIALSLAGKTVLAANDWTVPCTNGQCSYDLPSHSSASASVHVWGSPNAISDITEAAGWKILSCDAKSKNQTIRMVCTSSSAPCDHVLQDGAVHKLVRMPEACGSMPFARVANYSIADDQSIPDSLKRSLFGRGQSAQLTVHSLTLDTNFAAVNATQTGSVSFSVQGINVPGENGNFDIIPPNQKRRFVSRPVMSRHHDIVQSRGWIGDLQGKFNKTETKDLPAVDVNKQANVLNANVDCPDFKASLQASMDTKAHAQISLGVVAAGTAIPPKLTEFGILVGLTGDIDATLTVNASAEGSFDSGAIPIFSAGVPGLEIPGILTVGPVFTVSAELNGDVELDLDFNVGLSYKFDNAQLQFPPSTGSSGGSLAAMLRLDFALSADPNFSGNAHLVVHIIPEVAIEIIALEGVATSSIYLDLDASTTLDLQGAASASGSTGSTGKSGSGEAQACIDLSANLDVYMGAKAKFFSLFDENTKVTLYNKDFDLYKVCVSSSWERKRLLTIAQKCFGAATPSSSHAVASSTTSSLGQLVPIATTSSLGQLIPISTARSGSIPVTSSASSSTIYANASSTMTVSSDSSGLIAIASPTNGVLASGTYTIPASSTGHSFATKSAAVPGSSASSSSSGAPLATPTSPPK